MPMGEFVNWWILAPPLCGELLEVIKLSVSLIEKEIRKPELARMMGKQGVLTLTGPIVYTKGIQRYYERQNWELPHYNNTEFNLMYIYHLANEEEVHPELRGRHHYSMKERERVIGGVGVEKWRDVGGEIGLKGA